MLIVVKTLFNQAYGYIDLKKYKKVNRKSLFNIASISKSFTAVGILSLVQQKKIFLTDTIDKFFNNVPVDKLSITLNHLLSHQSGFQQNYICDGICDSNEAINSLLSDKLANKPGSSFGYSNQNYEMLALVIEKITSFKYEEFIRMLILEPLKMKDTCFWTEVGSRKNIASYNRDISDISTFRNWGFIGSGGMYSTPYDLYKFSNALLNYLIIDQQNTELLFKTYCLTSDGTGIGYGWFINEITNWNTKEIWTRGTEDWGHNAVLRWFPEKKTIIIVCTNSGEIGDKQITGNRIISSYIADFLLEKTQN